MVSRFVSAVSQVASYARSWGTPNAQEATATLVHRQNTYLIRWGYFDGTAYGPIEEWARYKDDHDLPLRIRELKNVAFKVAAFWSLHVYSGSLPEDGRTLPGGGTSAIPIDWGENEETLPDAVATLWRWWGWQEQMRLMVLYPSVLGETLVELIDDIPRRKIMADIVWPGYIKDVRLDSAGNLKSYTKEYFVQDDERGEHYLYTRTIDTRFIYTYKDGNPFDYDAWVDVDHGGIAVRENPYGFVPARWIRFWNTGSKWGEPAIFGTQAVMDEINWLWSMANDQLRVLLDSPILAVGTLTPGSISAAIDEYDAAMADRPVEGLPPSQTRMKIVEAEGDAKYILPDIDVSQVKQTIDDLNDEISTLVPESRFQEMIREMTSLSSAPAVERGMLDVTMRYRTISATMDRHSTSIIQMGVAMAGYRLNNGYWQASADEVGASLTDEQTVFAPYGLDSYAAGDLGFTILSRDLVPTTPEEEDQSALREIDAGIPVQAAVSTHMGYDMDDFTEWETRGWAPVGSWTGVVPSTTPVTPGGTTPADVDAAARLASLLGTASPAPASTGPATGA